MHVGQCLGQGLVHAVGVVVAVVWCDTVTVDPFVRNDRAVEIAIGSVTGAVAAVAVGANVPGRCCFRPKLTGPTGPKVCEVVRSSCFQIATEEVWLSQVR